jgi:predicted acyltransferase
MCGAAFPAIHHTPWDGIRLADFVMPFFDFMVGVSLAISLKRFGTTPTVEPVQTGGASAPLLRTSSGGMASLNADAVGGTAPPPPPRRGAAFWKATVRFLKIFLLGVWTQGGVSIIEINLSKVRVMGILQRVAVCYYVVAIMEIFLPQRKGPVQRRIPPVTHGRGACLQFACQRDTLC